MALAIWQQRRAERSARTAVGRARRGRGRMSAETFTRHDPPTRRASQGNCRRRRRRRRARVHRRRRGGGGLGGRSALERGEILRRAADLLEGRIEPAATRLVADIGKAIRDARAEAARAVAILRYHAADTQQPSGETYPSGEPGTLLMTLSEPVGVVCAITPWNFPLAIPAWKLARPSPAATR